MKIEDNKVVLILSELECCSGNFGSSWNAGYCSGMKISVTAI